MAGRLYGIGVGPGDWELMTLKAVRLIEECEVIVVPGEDYTKSTAYQIAAKAVPGLKEKLVVGIHMPMTKEKQILEGNYDRAAKRVIGWLKEGKDVGILTLGDVTIYSTCIYIYTRVKEAGYTAELVSGVPSFCAAAARLGLSLAERSEQIHILPASYQIEEGLCLQGTKILMKAGKQIKQVKEQIKAFGMEAVMVENCGMKGEQIYYCTDDMKEDAGYYSLIIVKDREGKSL